MALADLDHGGATLSAHTDRDAEPVRCRVCHRPVVAPESVRAELGPVCRFALAQRLARAAGAPVVLGERDGELLAWIGRAP